jgi:hypothetical protein
MMNSKENRPHSLINNYSNTMHESNAVIEESSKEDDPLIRATIDKFNHEMANEESHLC